MSRICKECLCVFRYSVPLSIPVYFAPAVAGESRIAYKMRSLFAANKVDNSKPFSA
jgi:hypothetical protein